MSITHLKDSLIRAREQYEEDGDDQEAIRVITNAIKELSKYNPGKSKYIIEETEND